jgi:hypothetical protein
VNVGTTPGFVVVAGGNMMDGEKEGLKDGRKEGEDAPFRGVN